MKFSWAVSVRSQLSVRMGPQEVLPSGCSQIDSDRRKSWAGPWQDLVKGE